jgi:hypothetical protein
MLSQVRIPTLIFVFFLIDVALGFIYVANALAGRPSEVLTNFFNLGREANLPTWYSSMQWFCVAVLLGMFVHHQVRYTQRKSWLLIIFPLVFLALSLDEVAQIHEKLARTSDLLLPGASRVHTPFSKTGIWMFVIGVPFLVIFVVLIFSIRSYFQHAPGAFVKILLGMTLALAGAIGFETLHNFVIPYTVYSGLQNFTEEMCEMLGSTVVLWGSYELLSRHGLVLRLDRAATDSSVLPGDTREAA